MLNITSANNKLLTKYGKHFIVRTYAGRLCSMYNTVEAAEYTAKQGRGRIIYRAVSCGVDPKWLTRQY